MTTRPSNFVTLDWLMPLFNSQLSKLYEHWQSMEKKVGEAHAKEMAASYHEISGALRMANLPKHAKLADYLSRLSEELIDGDKLIADVAYWGAFANEGLQSEINHFAMTGGIRQSLIDKYVEEITHLLPPSAVMDANISSSDLETAPSQKEQTLSSQLSIPKAAHSRQLTQNHLNQLLMVWRQNVTQLLLENTNESAYLNTLQKVSRYLWEADVDGPLQTLWYLSSVWLHNLTRNVEPKPSQLASTLFELNQVIASMRQLTGQSENDTIKASEVDSQLSAITIDKLTAEVCIRLSVLLHTDETAQAILDDINSPHRIDQEFLPRILTKLEALILTLHEPAAIIEPLTKIKHQLTQRGWSLYGIYIDQVISDLEQSSHSEEIFAQLQWQIERQLQELYASILTAHDHIAEKIGQPTNFSTAFIVNQDSSFSQDVDHTANVSSFDALSAQSDQSAFHSTPDKIRQLRITVEDIKSDFNSYLQQQQSALLPSAQKFATIEQAFLEMGLADVSEISRNIGGLFERLRASDVNSMSWRLINTLAETLASLELFLDYLAQQVFDESLLNQVQEHMVEASFLLDSGDDSQDDSPTYHKSNLGDATRYDDNGEVVSSALTADEPAFEPSSVEIIPTESALAPVIEDLAADGTVITAPFTDQGTDIEQPLADYDKALTATEDEIEAADTHSFIDQPVSVTAVNEESVTGGPVIGATALEESDALKAARSELKDDDFGMDEEIREIFIEEAEEVLEQLNENLPIWQNNPQDLTPLTEIRRGFHTLKGSGRMVGAFNTGEMAWAVENMLNRVLDHTLPVTDELIGFITDTKDLIPTLVADFAQQMPPSIDPAVTVLKAKNLLAGDPINQGLSIDSAPYSIADNVSHDEESVDSDELDASSLEISESLGTMEVSETQPSEDAPVLEDRQVEGLPQQSTNLPEALEPFIAEAQNIPADADDADPDIKEIFIEEAEEVLAEITPIFLAYQPQLNDEAALTEVRRGFHTLKGSGRMVGAHYSAELAWAVESMLNRVLEHTITPTTDMMKLVADVLEAYPSLVDTFKEDRSDYPTDIVLWIACANAYSKGLGDAFGYPAVMQSGSTDLSQPTLSASLNDDSADTLADVNLQEVDLESAESSNNESHESSDDNQDNDGDYNAPSSNSPAYQDDLIEGQTDANDVTLQSIYSVNQKMAESPVLAPPQSEEEQQFCEIFIEEARERLETIKAFVHQNKEATTIAVDDQIVRDFHTLRGASGAKSLTAISDISAAIEHSLEQLQNNDAMMSAQHLKALAQSVDLIENYLNAYDLSPNQDALDNDQNQHDLQSIQALLEDPESDDTVESTLSVAHLMSEDIDELLDADWNLESRLTDHDLEQVQHYAQTLSEQIQSLMQKSTDSKKFQVLLGSLLGVYQQIQKSPTLGDDDTVVEALLAGHNQLTGLFDALAGSMSLKLDNQVISNLNELAKPEGLKDGLEPNDQVDKSKNTQPNEQVDASSQSTLSPTNQEAAELQSSNASMAVVSTEASSNEASLAADSAISLDIEAIETDAELLEIFLEEAQELDAEINRAFAVWRADPSDMEALKELQRHLHTIKGGARMAGIKSIGDLTHEAETVYEYFVANRLTPSLGWVNVMQGVQDTLSAQIDYVVNHHQSFYTETLVSEMQNFISQGELPDDARVTTPIVNNPNAQNLTQASDADAAIEEDVVPEHDYEKMVARSWGGDKPDPDILTVFLEEAEELVASSSENLQAFRSNTSDIAALQALQRELHTVKGGARMVSANGIADLAHQMETVYEELASRRRPATRMVSQLLVACHDWLADAVMILKHQIDPPMPTQLIAALEQFSASPDSLQEIHPDSLQAELDAIDDYISQQHSGMGHHDITEMPPMSGGFSQSDTGATISNNEMIRISAGLIERMINLTGESAINRARIDMGMSSLTNSIEEMGITVQRLADQLRRMDIELEAQILSQIDEEMLNDEDFDPLEMDQYSALNQLSKSLSESASDLLDIKSTLLEKTRDSESLLLQLSRTQAELQDGLMNSRMVPFSRLVPRLQRIVRQTASELGKAVELSIVNADDEMDRTILERITSPLEHMLRNAVDHGIESPEDRLAAGKSRAGQVRLEVMREGSEVVIHLTDDGNGINVDAVRRKAISQGLIDANDTSLSDVDVMQYIFNAGLTTTQKVTQISGRGVGMDVVRSEIRQLGGVVSVESSVGGGSRFTIRVPLTVAVSDALVVRAADRYYAIPLVQIERVVRINPEELYAYYQSDSSSMTIGDTGYRVRYLNEILTGHALNELVVSTNTSLPVIIIKSQTGQTLAIQVDEIAGSRIEVVVKPLGRQLSHVSGISAATIMGDGSVMLILDLIALMRNAPAQAAQVAQQVEQSKPAEAVIDTTTTILVVDDSVTVRKVTSRFLERQGLEAVVAKDGVDAIEILQELTPDLILLDIEMPRMDGFEVATQVRHDSRLKNIPIIMITSRTGEKHRERAMEIGVNDYMGKPFQENELLSRIQGLLGAHVGNQNDE
ncbi:MAG: Hpt domain-containing protein [Psychrobacter sp.]|nr:Hpt domain-containing protein [Psychrobacter sp.]